LRTASNNGSSPTPRTPESLSLRLGNMHNPDNNNPDDSGTAATTNRSATSRAGYVLQRNVTPVCISPDLTRRA
jgi:hypothetical protein